MKKKKYIYFIVKKNPKSLGFIISINKMFLLLNLNLTIKTECRKIMTHKN